MFRARDAVKFGANGVCPICNSASGSLVDSAGCNHRAALLKWKPYVFIEGAR